MTGNKVKAGYTVLVVDDDVDFRRSQKRLLSLLSLAGTGTVQEVLEAETGAAAMAILAGSRVDCVLLDYRMPGGDGTIWLTRILAKHPGTAVIMVTGAGSEQVAAMAMRDGAVDYLVKGDISSASMERAVLNAVEKTELRNTIERQREQLVSAERHRAMIASLGAARHHLGQPVAVMVMYLELMKRKESDPEMLTMIHDCITAVGSVSEILDRLDRVSEFRTEPYLPAGEGEASGRDDAVILKI